MLNAQAIIQWLLDNGASQTDRYAFDCAASRRNIEAIRILLLYTGYRTIVQVPDIYHSGDILASMVYTPVPCYPMIRMILDAGASETHINMRRTCPQWYNDIVNGRAACRRAALAVFARTPIASKDMRALLAKCVLATRWNKEWIV